VAPGLVYAVDFTGGNLSPWFDSRGWGSMRIGGTGGANAASSNNTYGLTLSVTRDQNDPALITSAVYVLLPPNALPLSTRLRIRVEFDRPRAKPLPIRNPADGEIDTRSLPTPEPWAVVAIIKLAATEVDTDGQAMVPVTCQFKRDLNGIRLNTPQAEQSDQATIFISPLNYDEWNPPLWTDPFPPVPTWWWTNDLMPPRRFTLENAFCGIDSAAIGKRSVGSGTLSVTGLGSDHRVFSHTGITSSAQQDWIGALGASVATLGVGQMRARLRSFAVDIWS